MIPEFHQFNARIAAPGGFRLDNPASRGEYRTESGKATFHVCNLAAVDDALPVDSLVLTTIRSHDQYNTTIYGMDDRYRGVTGRRDIIFLSEEEARKRQLRQGDRVNIMALDARGEPDGEKALLNQTVFIVPMAASSIAAYLPEANILLSLDAVDKESLTPAYKSAPVLIIRA